MHTKEIEAAKRKLRLSKLQREVLIGLILGDGHLEKAINKKTYRLKVSHGIKQKEYVNWLENVWKNWLHAPPQIREKISPYSGKKIKVVEFATYSHGAFRFYYHEFYGRDNHKRIPDLIKKLLTPLGLAVWFMDDGSWKSKHHQTYIIHTDSRPKNDLRKLQKVLLEKFDVYTSLHRQYSGWRIYIKTISAQKFKNLIWRHIIPSMRYKLDNTLPKE